MKTLYPSSIMQRGTIRGGSFISGIRLRLLLALYILLSSSIPSLR